MFSKFKKVVITAVATLGILGAGVSQVHAGSGWQVIGYDWFNPADGNSSWETSTSGVFHSKDDGNVGFTIPDHSVYNHAYGVTPVIELQVYEDDPIGDDWIGTAYYYPYSDGTKTFSFNADAGEPEGNLPEVYVKYNHNYDGADFTVTVLD